MNINWYPGHMKKTTDGIKEHLNQVDIVCELLDSRIPISSRNPQLNDIIGDKEKIIILNKEDMSDPLESRKWIEYFEKNNQVAITYNSLLDKGAKKIYSYSKKILKNKFEKNLDKGISSKEIKMMVVGIPNVGKSAFINNLSGKKKTNVGNKPGVTRQKQWIRTNTDLVLLDTPGVLWPKIESKESALNLAYTGAIKDENLDIENVSYKFIEKINEIDPNIFIDRYNIEETFSTIECMDRIARKTGSIMRGNEIDYNKVSRKILDDFRKVRLGRITLERVEDEKRS